MEDSKKEKIVKPNRQRYFHLIMRLVRFVPQKLLELTLYDLVITNRDRQISIKNFDGQLERDSEGIPYWNIYLQTTALTTSRSVLTAISEALDIPLPFYWKKYTFLIKNFPDQISLDTIPNPIQIPFEITKDNNGIYDFNNYCYDSSSLYDPYTVRMMEFFTNDIDVDLSELFEISSLSDFQQCKREKLVSIPNSDYYPGYFSKSILEFEELLKDERVIQKIKEMPKRYPFWRENKDEKKMN